MQILWKPGGRSRICAWARVEILWKPQRVSEQGDSHGDLLIRFWSAVGGNAGIPIFAGMTAIGEQIRRAAYESVARAQPIGHRRLRTPGLQHSSCGPSCQNAIVLVGTGTSISE